MIIQAKILAVNVVPHVKKQTGEVQQKAEIVMQTTNPSELFMATLWSASVAKGEHLPFKALEGKDCLIASRFELFNGHLKLELNTSVQPVEVASARPAAMQPRPAPAAQSKSA